MTDFITTTEVGDYAGRDLSSDDGATLAVAMACQVVRTLTEQDFETATSTVKLDGTGTDTIFLPQRPVSTVGTVTVNGEAETDYTFTPEGRLIRTSDDAPSYSTWASTEIPSASWPGGRQNVEVTYEYGADVPEDIRMVALMLAYRLVTQGGSTQEQVGDVKKTYAVAASDLTNGEKAILAKYRR
jgi:hypothetical protein